MHLHYPVSEEERVSSLFVIHESRNAFGIVFYDGSTLDREDYLKTGEKTYIMHIPPISGTLLAVVKLDEKGRILLSKELRKAVGVEQEDHLIAKPLGSGKILLEKTTRRSYPKKDPLDWLLNHPARIRSKRIKAEIRKKNSSRELLEEWKQHLWLGV